MIDLILRTLRGFRHDQRGSMLVEMTLVTPLMILLSAGVFEFGNLIHNKLLMEAGLDDAARFAARCNSKLYTENGLATIDCGDIARNLAIFGNIAGTGARRVGCDPDDPACTSRLTVTVSIADAADCHDAVVGGITQYQSVTPQVCIVQATGSLTYAGVGLLAAIGIGPITLTGSHEERLIRF